MVSQSLLYPWKVFLPQIAAKHPGQMGRRGRLRAEKGQLPGISREKRSPGVWNVSLLPRIINIQSGAQRVLDVVKGVDSVGEYPIIQPDPLLAAVLEVIRDAQ